MHGAVEQECRQTGGSAHVCDNSMSEQGYGARALLCKVLYKMENNNNNKISIYK